MNETAEPRTELSQNPVAVRARAHRAAARAAEGAAPVQAPAQAEMLARMEAMLASVVEQNKALTEKVQKLEAAPRLPMVSSPEKKLADFMKSMRPGEQRDGIRAVIDSDIAAMDGAYKTGDIVAIKGDTQKAKAWQRTLKSEDPIYGQVLQYIGRTQNKRGPRKYKVHFAGIGRDGVTEDEIEFVKAA